MAKGDNRILLSITIPVYNEIGNIADLYNRLLLAIRSLQRRYEFEFVFTDNHSEDGSFEKLRDLAQRDPRVRVIRFSKNFGYQRSILTGLLRARGEAAIQLDSDLQDPPELIPTMVKLWEEGANVVYGVRRSRQEGWVTNQLRKAYYKGLNWISEEAIPADAGDFRLVDRSVLEQLRNIRDENPYLRGIIAGLGFSQKALPYDRAARTKGESKFPMKRMISIGLDGILNHSTVPLRLAMYTGIVVSLATILGTLGYIGGKLLLGADWPRGFATTTVLILMSLGLNALFLGIIGEYLGRIYRQMKRPGQAIIEAEVEGKNWVKGQLSGRAPKATPERSVPSEVEGPYL